MENPTLELYLKHVSQQKYTNLVIEYLASKGIIRQRVTTSKNTGFELTCWFVDRNKEKYPDLIEGVFIKNKTILQFPPKTQRLLKPFLNKKLYFEIKGTKFNPNDEPSQKR